MKPEIISFKSAEEVIRIHDNIIQEFGGRHGILNMGLLESAINQPFNVWLYETKNNRKIYNEKNPEKKVPLPMHFHISEGTKQTIQEKENEERETNESRQFLKHAQNHSPCDEGLSVQIFTVSSGRSTEDDPNTFGCTSVRNRFCKCRFC